MILSRMIYQNYIFNYFYFFQLITYRQRFRLKFQRIWDINKILHDIFYGKKNIFGTCSKKCQIFHCIYCTRATRFNGKQFSHVFSLEHVFSKDETKNSRIACLLGTAVFLLCNRKNSYVFSSCFSAALSFAGRKKKKKKKKREKKRKRKERPAWKGTWTSRFIHVLPVSTGKRDLSKWRETFLF